MKKSVLIISTTDQNRDPRVLRQIDFLKEDFDVWCCGLNNTVVDNERFIKLNINNSTVSRIPVFIMRLFKLYDSLEDNWIKNKISIDTDKINFDCIIANDLDTLPLAFKFFESENVICDFHEYAPAEFEDKFVWRLLHRDFAVHQCKKYFPKLKAVTTVCDGIADEFHKNFNKRPVVITNAAEFHDLHPSDTGNKIRLIHHGVAISSRKLELMIEVAKLLDERFSLDLMLVPNEQNYYNKLKMMTRNYKNISIIEPVTFNEIIKFCNSYDVGIVIVPPVNTNYKFGLGNKFFEFIQSRLAIITGPMVEMMNYINEYGLGLATKTFVAEEIANEINKLTNEQIEQFKNNSHRYAMELSSEKNKVLLNNILNNLLNNKN